MILESSENVLQDYRNSGSFQNLLKCAGKFCTFLDILENFWIGTILDCSETFLKLLEIWKDFRSFWKDFKRF